MSIIQMKPSTMLSPVPPCIVTCGSMESPNAITVAWTGIINSIPPKTYISVRKERFSHHIIKETGEFVIHTVNKKLAFAADYCGMKSGKDTDKFKEMHFDSIKANCVGCPIIGQSPLALECRVTDVISLGSHDMFIADILCTDVDEQYIDEKGKICLDKAMLVAYTHGDYFLLGEHLGRFGFSLLPKKDRKKTK